MSPVKPGTTPALGRPERAEKSDMRNMLEKAIELLHEVGSRPAGGQAADIAKVCDIPLSTAYRLLGTLSQHGLLEMDKQTRRYSLGLEVYALSQSVAQARGLTGVAGPVLEELSEITREATLMAIQDGSRQLYIHYVPGPHLVSVVGRPGTSGPLHCTAMGKVLVAGAPDAIRKELTETVELKKFGPHCITQRERFRSEIERVRENGWGIADEEHEAGIRSIAVPVLRPHSNTARAAISIAAPSLRVSTDLLMDWLPQLRDAASRIALLMPQH